MGALAIIFSSVDNSSFFRSIFVTVEKAKIIIEMITIFLRYIIIKNEKKNQITINIGRNFQIRINEKIKRRSQNCL